MENKSKVIRILILIVAACIVMAFIDAVIAPGYLVKSLVKLLLFLGIPLGYAVIHKGIPVWDMFRIRDKKALIIPVLLGMGVYAFILLVYFILGPYFDFSGVTGELTASYGVNKDNFVWVALYISFVNSFLEEFFFRGFAFLTLKKFTSKRFAYLFSAGTFALYHVAIMSDWFQAVLFLLLIFSLFIAGVFFNRLNEKGNNIYNSWLVHMCANFAINTIGFILFGIIG